MCIALHYDAPYYYDKPCRLGYILIHHIILYCEIPCVLHYTMIRPVLDYFMTIILTVSWKEFLPDAINLYVNQWNIYCGSCHVQTHIEQTCNVGLCRDCC